MSTDHSMDLPLMANSHEILVKHFILDIDCFLQEGYFDGSVALFLEPIGKTDDEKKHSIFSIHQYHSFMKNERSNIGQSSKTADLRLLDKTEVSMKQGKRDHEKDSTCSSESITNTCLTGHTEIKNATDPFCLVLDCFHMEISKVASVDCTGQGDFNELTEESRIYLLNHLDCETNAMEYAVEKWCLRIWNNKITSKFQFPKVVRIWFRTKRDGPSLKWTHDIEGRPCVYTAASWANNRSLLPCQEFSAFSTWQCRVRAPDGATVVMSGDQASDGCQQDGGWMEYYYECSMPLPSFTLTLAVGYWNVISSLPDNKENNQHISNPCFHQPKCKILYSDQEVLPFRLIGPASLLSKAQSVVMDYIPKAMKSAQSLLGASPFPRLDVVLYPPSSQDMAFASPSVIFLSSSVLAEDRSLNIKIGHELSHFWFGLLIGARDWTEEWLSEGFATYMEDFIHAQAMGWDDAMCKQRAEIRALLRYQTLLSEMSNTESSIQILRPNKGTSQESTESIMYVKNGMNPNKQFTQVHYLKGYFLLRHLASKVGFSSFNNMIKSFVQQFHGEMILSTDVLQFALSQFPALIEQGITVESIYANWLDCAGMPKDLENFLPSSDNEAYSEFLTICDYWKKIARSTKRKRKGHVYHTEINLFVNADLLVLLLEEILTLKSVGKSILAHLNKVYTLSQANAEVMHRWCELIVKHRYTASYKDVEFFLINHQAMGVYLYGEMMISGCQVQRQLAQDCFSRVRIDMENGTHNTVHMMLYGTSPDSGIS